MGRSLSSVVCAQWSEEFTLIKESKGKSRYSGSGVKHAGGIYIGERPD